MQDMGAVLHYDSKGNLVAELKGKIPKLGTIVTDESGRRVGRVSDVIGNVKRPYLVIKTTRKDDIHTIYMGKAEKKLNNTPHGGKNDSKMPRMRLGKICPG